MNFRERDRLTIFLEILKTTEAFEEGRKKTNIMRSVNLSHPQVNKYLNLLLINGLLHLNSEGRYKPTEKGLELIESLESLSLEPR